MTETTTIEVRKDDLSATRAVPDAAPALRDGDARVRIERFAITANNVTYGVVGERIGYWRFFPASADGWGVIPVWGVAEVVESVSTLKVGERLYGYWPMATHLTLTPGRVKPATLFDGAPHRAELPMVYNRYSRLSADPGYDPASDRERGVLQPLLMTSYCLYDWLLANDWHGAAQVVIPSASSKTAIGTAYALKSDAAPPRIIGVTSPKNAAAIAALGLYDDIILYDETEAKIAVAPTVIIDMSGSGAVVGRLHRHLGDAMRFTSNVGVTHYDDAGMGPDFIRERSAMFFAPAHIAKRAEDWGPGEFERRAAGFMATTIAACRSWLTIRTGDGPDAVQAAWSEVLAGATPPDQAWAVAV